jgi:hypothetical protein
VCCLEARAREIVHRLRKLRRDVWLRRDHPVMICRRHVVRESARRPLAHKCTGVPACVPPGRARARARACVCICASVRAAAAMRHRSSIPWCWRGGRVWRVRRNIGEERPVLVERRCDEVECHIPCNHAENSRSAQDAARARVFVVMPALAYVPACVRVCVRERRGVDSMTSHRSQPAHSWSPSRMHCR